MLNHQIRRGLGIAVPLFSALLFWGGVTAIFGIGEHENIKQTGITLAGIFGFLNAWLVYLVWKHRIP